MSPAAAIRAAASGGGAGVPGDGAGLPGDGAGLPGDGAGLAGAGARVTTKGTARRRRLARNTSQCLPVRLKRRDDSRSLPLAVVRVRPTTSPACVAVT
jgi:hypothetical protein